MDMLLPENISESNLRMVVSAGEKLFVEQALDMPLPESISESKLCIEFSAGNK